MAEKNSEKLEKKEVAYILILIACVVIVVSSGSFFLYDYVHNATVRDNIEISQDSLNYSLTEKNYLIFYYDNRVFEHMKMEYHNSEEDTVEVKTMSLYKDIKRFKFRDGSALKIKTDDFTGDNAYLTFWYWEGSEK